MELTHMDTWKLILHRCMEFTHTCIELFKPRKIHGAIKDNLTAQLN